MGFRKAKAEQAALKMAIYGPPGRGKTLSALLIAEGLAALTKKRIAYVDTERGTDFYAKEVPARDVHPSAFDFDAVYSRSLTEVCTSIKELRFEDHAVIVLDSITHLWEAAIGAYEGKRTSIDSIPMHAWGQIKKPYKDLIRYLLSSPFHVIICGRQGNEFGENEDGELKKTGVKLKAEGETAYEPHILLRMETSRGEDGVEHILAVPEKDRSGVLAGRKIQVWPAPTSFKGNYTFEVLAKPIISLLGGTQAAIESDDEVSAKDAGALADQEEQKRTHSEKEFKRMCAKLELCTTMAELKALGKEISPEYKKKMLPAHVTGLREKYLEIEGNIKAELSEASHGV